MAPLTHLLASWFIAAKTTANARDTRLVTLAGIAPDLDGLGLVVDMAQGLVQGQGLEDMRFHWYQSYHHFLLHGLPGALAIAVLAMLFATQRWRVFLLTLVLVHLHFLCDLLGSRGPTPDDIWPLFYLGPFSKEPMWLWRGQWPLNAWPLQLLAWALLACALAWGVRRGDSFIAVFSRRADAIFLRVLRRWAGAILTRRT
jgi:hypothetical protein